jgi:hypothetical protein
MMYSSYYRKEGALLSVSDFDRYVITRKLLDYTAPELYTPSAIGTRERHRQLVTKTVTSSPESY